MIGPDKPDEDDAVARMAARLAGRGVGNRAGVRGSSGASRGPSSAAESTSGGPAAGKPDESYGEVSYELLRRYLTEKTPLELRQEFERKHPDVKIRPPHDDEMEWTARWPSEDGEEVFRAQNWADLYVMLRAKFPDQRE